jgi:hypothetical protein
VRARGRAAAVQAFSSAVTCVSTHTLDYPINV